MCASDISVAFGAKAGYCVAYSTSHCYQTSAQYQGLMCLQTWFRMTGEASFFYIHTDLGGTAFSCQDVQTQILARFSDEVQKAYLESVLTLLNFFRDEAERRRQTERWPCATLYNQVPMIIHHTLSCISGEPFNLNSNGFVSPYNKLARTEFNL
ncbi:hypothetical protein BX600DRAFT_435675 [Xylariales sp. PMI_506]|nr:hypothetical protein BX600DRAFT_435675 [Xylariales sp. PMI_506]